MSWECVDPYHPGVTLPPGRGWLGHCAALCYGAKVLKHCSRRVESLPGSDLCRRTCFLKKETKQDKMCLSYRWCTSQPRILTSCCSYCFAVASLCPALSTESSSISRQTSTNWRSRRYALHLTGFSWEMFGSCIFWRWLRRVYNSHTPFNVLHVYS